MFLSSSSAQQQHPPSKHHLHGHGGAATALLQTRSKTARTIKFNASSFFRRVGSGSGGPASDSGSGSDYGGGFFMATNSRLKHLVSNGVGVEGAGSQRGIERPTTFESHLRSQQDQSSTIKEISSSSVPYSKKSLSFLLAAVPLGRRTLQATREPNATSQLTAPAGQKSRSTLFSAPRSALSALCSKADKVIMQHTNGSMIIGTSNQRTTTASSTSSGVSTTNSKQSRLLSNTERKEKMLSCRMLRTQIQRLEDAFKQVHGHAPKSDMERGSIMSTMHAKYRQLKRSIRIDAVRRIQATYRGWKMRQQQKRHHHHHHHHRDVVVGYANSSTGGGSSHDDDDQHHAFRYISLNDDDDDSISDDHVGGSGSSSSLLLMLENMDDNVQSKSSPSETPYFQLLFSSAVAEDPSHHPPLLCSVVVVDEQQQRQQKNSIGRESRPENSRNNHSCHKKENNDIKYHNDDLLLLLSDVGVGPKGTLIASKNAHHDNPTEDGCCYSTNIANAVSSCCDGRSQQQQYQHQKHQEQQRQQRFKNHAYSSSSSSFHHNNQHHHYKEEEEESQYHNYSQLQILKEEKKKLMEQLKDYERNFIHEHGRRPMKAETERIRHLYDRYNIVKDRIMSSQLGRTATATKQNAHEDGRNNKKHRPQRR